MANKSHVVLSWLLTHTADINQRLAMNLLNGVLLENSASPLRQYLETCGLGESPSPMCGLDDAVSVRDACGAFVVRAGAIFVVCGAGVPFADGGFDEG